jgi:hypothetical protein
MSIQQKNGGLCAEIQYKDATAKWLNAVAEARRQASGD